MRATVIAGSFLLASSSAAAAFAQQATTPGATSSPYPTLSAISLEWAITGDDDAEGVGIRQGITDGFKVGAARWDRPTLKVRSAG